MVLSSSDKNSTSRWSADAMVSRPRSLHDILARVTDRVSARQALKMQSSSLEQQAWCLRR
jgi:hypothetical protein